MCIYLNLMILIKIIRGFISAGYWFLQLLDKVTPSQWAAIGVLGSLVFGLLTYLTNLYFKIKEDKRKAARGE